MSLTASRRLTKRKPPMRYASCYRSPTEGVRARPAGDTAALEGCIVTVGDLLDTRKEIAELDVNPVLATSDGTVALNAFVRLRE